MADAQDTKAKTEDTQPEAPATPKPEAKDQAPAKPDAEAKDQAPVEETSRTAPPLPEGVHYIWGTGRRKKSIARVRIRPGTGQFVINKKQIDVYFTADKDRAAVIAPLQAVGMLKSWDVFVNAGGGGTTGQAGAVSLGLARALVKAVPDGEANLRSRGLMTRDARMKERKKYGQPGARKRFQFSKR